MTKFDKVVSMASQACTQERAKVAEKTTEFEALNDQAGRVVQGIRQLQTEAANPTMIKRVVAGVEIEEPAYDKREDMAALVKRRDQLPELIRAASHERDKAKRRLSQAVAAKLAEVEAEFKARTLKLLEAATELCKDADSLETAMAAAGLDPSYVYAVRFEGIQNLRTDQATDGASIAARLKEVA